MKYNRLLTKLFDHQTRNHTLKLILYQTLSPWSVQELYLLIRKAVDDNCTVMNNAYWKVHRSNVSSNWRKGISRRLIVPYIFCFQTCHCCKDLFLLKLHFLFHFFFLSFLPSFFLLFLLGYILFFMLFLLVFFLICFIFVFSVYPHPSFCPPLSLSLSLSLHIWNILYLEC